MRDPQEVANDSEFIRRFETEAQLVARLEHRTSSRSTTTGASQTRHTLMNELTGDNGVRFELKEDEEDALEAYEHVPGVPPVRWRNDVELLRSGDSVGLAKDPKAARLRDPGFRPSVLTNAR